MRSCPSRRSQRVTITAVLRHPGLPDLPDHLEAVRPTVVTTVVGEVSNPHQAARSPHLEAVRPTVVTTVAGEVSNPHQAARSPHRAASSPHQARQVPAVMTVARDQAALPHRARSPPKSSGVNVRRASLLLAVLTNLLSFRTGGGFYYKGTTKCPDGAYCHKFSDCTSTMHPSDLCALLTPLTIYSGYSQCNLNGQ